jgi:hypothetical protein
MNKILSYSSCLLFAVILIGMLGSGTEGVSLVEVTPKQIEILGNIGSSSFQDPLTVLAAEGDISNLTFTSSNLMEATDGRSWITSTNILVMPSDKKDIKKGQSRDFSITVQNVPSSGQYKGTLYVSYNDKQDTYREALPISVLAFKINATPPKILLKFEKAILFPDKDSIQWAADLNGERGWIPDSVISVLEGNMSAILGTLINGEDMSQVRADQILQKAVVETASDRQGLELNATFINPQGRNPSLKAGKYIGTLMIRSKDLGVVATLPVELQVRYSSLAAWILIALGIFTSILLQWWNTTGKKKNTLDGDLLSLEEKVKGANITNKCREKINEKIWEARDFAHRGKLENAETSYTAANASLQDCETKKQGLDKQSNEIDSLISGWSTVEQKIKEIYPQIGKQPPTTAIMENSNLLKNYVPGIRKDLADLKKNIGIKYQDTVELDLTMKEQIASLQIFTAQRPDGILDSLLGLRKSINEIGENYRSELENRIHNIGSILLQINDKRAPIDLLDGIKSFLTDMRSIASLIEELNKLENHVIQFEKQGIPHPDFKYEFLNCRNAIMQSDIRTATDAIEILRSKILGLPHAARKDDKAAVSASAVNTEVYTLVSKAAEYSVEEHKIDACIEISAGAQSRIKLACNLAYPVRLIAHVISQFKANLIAQLTPDRREFLINAVVFLIAIPILAIIGYNQLYASNATFGSKSVLEEYLALFLWGFGIQMGSATVSSILKNLQGSA